MFKENILKNYDGLTPGYRKIADFILNNTIDVAFLTISELARRAQVDPATVIRFSQELGYSGYRELAYEIKDHVHAQVTATYREVEEGKTEEELLYALQQNTLQNLQYFGATETSTLARVINVIQDATHVWIVGEFLSYELTRILAAQLRMIEKPATAFRPSVAATTANLAQMKQSDVLFAIAIAHFGIDTGYAIKMAREKGLMTVCLTGPGTLLPAREAEITLITPTKRDASLISYDIPMVVLSLIFSAMIDKLSPKKRAEIFTKIYTYMGRIQGFRAATSQQEIP